MYSSSVRRSQRMTIPFPTIFGQRLRRAWNAAAASSVSIYAENSSSRKKRFFLKPEDDKRLKGFVGPLSHLVAKAFTVLMPFIKL